jgi:uncharacterized protein (DUF2345 family)
VVIHTGDSTIKVLANGKISMVAKDEIRLEVGGHSVALNKAGKFEVKATEVDATKGIFKTKNIQDLG